MRSCIISVALLISSPSLWTYTVSAAYLTQYEQNTLKEKGITLKDFSHEYWLLKSNGIPKHPTGVFPNNDNPNTISEQNYEYLIPKNPMRLDNDKNSESNYECLDMGVIAFASNGVPLFNPYSAEGFNAVEGPCSEVFDICNAHPDTLGRYHYHQFPKCLYGVPEQYSRLYGVALDGFPIYGPYEIDGTLVDASKLDECHGRTSNDGRYEYRITFNFPYILGCYRGKPGSQLSSGSGSQVNVRSEPGPQPNNGSQIYSGMGSGSGSGSGPQNGSAFGPQGGSQSYSGSGSGSGPQVGVQNYFGSGSGSGPYSGSQSYSGSGSGTGPQVGGQMYSGSGSGSGPYFGSQSFLGSGSGSGNQVNGQNYFGSGSGPHSGSQSYSGSGSGSGNQFNGQNYFGSGSGSGPYSGSQSYSSSGSGSGNQISGQNYFGSGSGSGSGNQVIGQNPFGSGSGSGPYSRGQSYSGSGSGSGNQVSGQNYFGQGSGSGPYSGSQSFSGSGSGSGYQISAHNYFGQGSGSGSYSGSKSYSGSGSGSGSLSQSQMQTGSGSGFNIGSQGTDQTFGESGSGSWGSFSGNKIMPPSRRVSTGESPALAALLRMLKIDGRSDRVRKSLDKYYQSDSKGQLLNGLRELLNQLAATKRADSSCVKDENWMQQEGVCPLKCENPSLGCN